VVDGWGEGAHSSVSLWGLVSAGWQRQRHGTGVVGSRPLGSRARQRLGWPGGADWPPCTPCGCRTRSDALPLALAGCCWPWESWWKWVPG